MIQLTSISKYYGSTVGVEELNFQIPDSQIFALLGPNGSGKTTTLRLISGLIAPSKGQILIDGVDASDKTNLAAIHRIMGILPEMAGHYESLSAYRNLEFYGRMYGLNDETIRSRVKELMTEFDLWQARENAVATFSKGMKQKLAIIRAIIHEPKYVILDEPISGLDPEAAHFVREYMKTLKSQGKTVILSTHDLADADRLSDTVAVVKNRLLAIDSPSNLKQSMFSRTVVFHLKTAEGLVLDEIKKFPFVRKASISGGKIVLELDSPEDNNPEIADYLVRKGFRIQFIGEIRRSLEDVYLTIVEKSRGEPK